MADREPPPIEFARERPLYQDALWGLLLALLVVLAVLFSTGEDSSFIYIDF